MSPVAGALLQLGRDRDWSPREIGLKIEAKELLRMGYIRPTGRGRFALTFIGWNWLDALKAREETTSHAVT